MDPARDTTLVDYFAVAGFDPETGLVLETTFDGLDDEPTSSKTRPLLERSFVPKIIQHFPDRRKEYRFPDEILSLCMPRGLKFYTEKTVPKSPYVHTFANIREDGSRINGTCITFYEEVRDPMVCEAVARLQQEHVRGAVSRRDSGGRQQVGDKERSHFPPGTVSGGTHTLPRLRRDHTKRTSYYEGGGQSSLYMTKVLCLLTRLPLVTASSTLLKSFHSLLTSSAPPPLALESYIYWCLYELPMPLPGTTLKIPLLDSLLVVQRPGPTELPFFDDCIGNIFEFLTVEKFIRLFSCFLLEYQILICSKNFDSLMTFCESLLALAFPFKWQMVYVPILPYSQLKFVEAPVPYVMGLCYEDKVPENLFQSNVCVVDVDNRTAEMPEDVPTFPAAKQLCADIASAIKRFSTCDSITNGTLERRASDASKGCEFDTPQVKMRHVAGRSSSDWIQKRKSKSFDGLNGDDFDYSQSNKDHMINRPIEDVLRGNSTFAQVSEIAQRVGVNVDMKNLAAKLGASQNLESPVSKNYFNNAKLNNAIRESVLNKFIGMFVSYEHFVIGGQGCPDRETYESTRDSMASFDKASFLSDQPDSHLSFLSAFLETQMFTSFIDAKILSQWEQPDEALLLFDARIAAMREKEKMGVSMVRTPTSESAAPFVDSEQLIMKREAHMDYVVPEPHPLAGAVPVHYNGAWPVYQLNTMLLDGASMMSPAPSPWKQRNAHVRHRKVESIVNGNVRPTSTYGGAGLMVDASLIAKQQCVFVEKLLAETKAKTKRMLVDKMGKEALQLGHLDAGITGVEENTLVASFCDLLERIWSHGLKNKQGKSALWNFVLQHQDFEKPGLTTRAASTSLLTPGQRSSRDPSLPPTRYSRPIDRVPDPMIIHPSTNDTLSTLAANLVDSIKLGSDESWSKRLHQAANFLTEKIANVQPDVNGNPPTRTPIDPPPRLPPPLPHHMRPRNMRKSSSFTTGEFTSPSWSPLPPSVNDQHTQSHRSGAASCESSPRKVRSTSTNRSRARSPEGARVVLAPLPVHIAYDLKNVLRMTEIKTDIGYARAFVRLALERKLLHKHLTTLLNNDKLMSQLYKEYAFVRFEEEKEQFLYHILSLNAAQFRCFTNTFTKTKMDYQVVIVSGAWRGTLPPIWVTIEGTLCSTPPITLKSNSVLFKFDHKNLGILSTLRIGHQETEKPQKWFLEYVLVRNEITGQMYRFPCGRWFGEDRWFGRGGEEGTLERLLIAEPFNEAEEANTAAADPASPARSRRMTARSQTPQRERSPSAGRIPEQMNSSNKKTRISDVEQFLGEAVNALVRYYHSEKKIKSELANMLCGQRGLVTAIEAAFQVGRQESLWTPRIFRSSYPWDYIEKVTMWFFDLKRRKGDEKLPKEHQALIDFCLMNQMLSSLLKLMAWTPVTAEFYNEPSFLRTAQHLNYLSQLLKALNEFAIEFDSTLTYGIV